MDDVASYMSNVLFFGSHSMRRRCKHRINIQVEIELLSISNRARNIRIIMDSLIIKQAYCNIELIYSDFFDIIKNFFLTHFNYLDAVCGSTVSITDARHLQLLQNSSCIRLVYRWSRRELYLRI